jgi:hypothetical protein
MQPIPKERQDTEKANSRAGRVAQVVENGVAVPNLERESQHEVLLGV